MQGNIKNRKNKKYGRTHAHRHAIRLGLILCQMARPTPTAPPSAEVLYPDCTGGRPVAFLGPGLRRRPGGRRRSSTQMARGDDAWLAWKGTSPDGLAVGVGPKPQPPRACDVAS